MGQLISTDLNQLFATSHDLPQLVTLCERFMAEKKTKSLHAFLSGYDPKIWCQQDSCRLLFWCISSKHLNMAKYIYDALPLHPWDLKENQKKSLCSSLNVMDFEMDMIEWLLEVDRGDGWYETLLQLILAGNNEREVRPVYKIMETKKFSMNDPFFDCFFFAFCSYDNVIQIMTRSYANLFESALRHYFSVEPEKRLRRLVEEPSIIHVRFSRSLLPSKIMPCNLSFLKTCFSNQMKNIAISFLPHLPFDELSTTDLESLLVICMPHFADVWSIQCFRRYVILHIETVVQLALKLCCTNWLDELWKEQDILLVLSFMLPKMAPLFISYNQHQYLKQIQCFQRSAETL